MIDNTLILLPALAAGAYLVGSTPFGFLIGRLRGVDLRKAGSGNVGATNVARVLGRRWGYLCFALDAGKGLLVVLAAGACLGLSSAVPTPLQQAAWLGAGLGVILGHVFTFWLKFRGGKGVATALGVVLGMYPYFTWAGLAAMAIWVAVTLLSRYVSLGSIVAAAAFGPLFIAFNAGRWTRLWPMAIFAALISLLIIVRHRANIRRLISGGEGKIRGHGR
jgi:acyl phosphate:glycerol-3-phosphate acyltransferase